MGATSIKPESQALEGGLRPLPRIERDGGGLGVTQPDYWRGVAASAGATYRDVLTSPFADFVAYLRNSLIVAALSVVGMVVSCSVVAYGLSRIRWQGRGVLFLITLATMMIPATVLMAPQFILFKHLGWIGTYRPLWVPAWLGGAFGIFLMRQFFLGIPRELDEAARLDGCSHPRIFVSIILPLARPALAVVALFQFTASWNDFVLPLIVLNHEHEYTLGVGLYMFVSKHGSTPWNQVMAASVLAILPVLVLFLLTQRAFVEGIATRGLKD
ncbi:MAG: carbohydrate ABC transporter permease [Phycisphaeraceae bacterium]|nr:carbohydrate ABC transporter permease [Phycisphaeraceae bacterium]